MFGQTPSRKQFAVTICVVRYSWVFNCIEMGNLSTLLWITFPFSLVLGGGRGG